MDDHRRAAVGERDVSGHHARLSGPRWAQTRRMVLEAARWRCERCGAAGRLEVHHVEPLHGGGAACDPDNLEVVCRGCHIEAHRRPLTPEEEGWRDLVAELADTPPR